ncbi:MAG: hypothetical protein AAFV26_08605, partial [Pseudomonadota bacterium]
AEGLSASFAGSEGAAEACESVAAKGRPYCSSIAGPTVCAATATIAGGTASRNRSRRHASGVAGYAFCGSIRAATGW